jgi:MAPEG family
VWLIHLLCLVFLAGRAIHAYGVSQVQEDYRLRSTGMAITFGVIAVTALVLVAQGFNYLAASLTSEARRRGGLRRGPRISVVLPTTGGRNSACGRMCLPTPPACGGLTVSSKLSAPGEVVVPPELHESPA